MAIKKTNPLSLELATIFARVYQPVSNTAKTPIPMVNPPDNPINKGLILVFSRSRLAVQYATNFSFSLLSMRQKYSIQNNFGKQAVNKYQSVKQRKKVFSA